MNQQVGEIFDIIILVLFLAIGLDIGVKALCEVNREVQESALIYMDKNTTVKYTPSEKIYGSYDGSMTAAEVLLMTQIQDFNMPYPDIITYDDLAIQIKPGYKEYLSINASALWGKLKLNTLDTSYLINYNFEKDSYDITKK